MKHVDLDALIEAIANRDSAAFSRLYVVTAVRVTAVALSILRHRDDAEDAVQEIYIKVWKQSGSFNRASGSGSEWIGAIARNHAIDLKRVRKPSASCIDDEFNLATSGPNPEEMSIASSDRAAVNRSMSSLAPDRANAVTQAYVQGFSCRQLADIHDVPVNTMKTWLRRSLLTMRDSLSEKKLVKTI